MSSPDGFNLGRSVVDYRQPLVPAAKIAAAAGALRAYRFMAFLTGVVLLSACITLIITGAMQGTLHPDNPVNFYVWMAHGWFYLIYVIVTATLGFKLRWPLVRYALVMLAGTVPTMSFVAEHFVTRAVRSAASEQPVAVPE